MTRQPRRFVGHFYKVFKGQAQFGARGQCAADFPKGHGAQILKELAQMYDGMEVILLIESLHEECDNMDIRIRRKGFYLRNGFYDTEYIQSTCEGAAIYDILSTSQEFSTEKWNTFVAHYPLEATFDDFYKAINQDTI